jgi:hypothetical protein
MLVLQLRNNNSSRFGKWMEIHFNGRAQICGAKVRRLHYMMAVAVRKLHLERRSLTTCWKSLEWSSSPRMSEHSTFSIRYDKLVLTSKYTGLMINITFLQLCAAAAPDIKDRFALAPAENFNYINKSGCITVETLNDHAVRLLLLDCLRNSDSAMKLQEHKELVEAFHKLEFTQEEFETLFQLVAGILHLSNVEVSLLR